MGYDTAFLNPEEIFRFIAAGSDHDGGRNSVRLFCHEGRPRQVMCILGAPLDDQSRILANGSLYAARSGLTKVFYVSEAFRCANRKDGQLAVRSCDDCHAALHGTRITILQDGQPRSL